MHDPGPAPRPRRVFCRRCGQRLYQNTGSLIRERHPDEWGAFAPVGSLEDAGFLFTCPAAIEEEAKRTDFVYGPPAAGQPRNGDCGYGVVPEEWHHSVAGPPMTDTPADRRER